MLGLTIMEISSILLNMVFNCVYSYFLFCFYSEPKKSKIRSFIAVCSYYPIIVVSEICSLSIYKEHPQKNILVVIFFFTELAICFWPFFVSNFYKRKRFDSQFLAYFTNSLNPFLFAFSLLSKLIITNMGLYTYSIKAVLIDRLLFCTGILLFVPIVKKYIVLKIGKIPRLVIKGLVFFVPISQIFPFLTNNRNNEIFNSPLFYIIMVALGISSVTCGFIIYKYSNEVIKREKLELAMKFEEDKKNYFDIIEQHSEKISKMSHDITNHLHTIQLLAQNEENSELAQYSKNLVTEYSESLKMYCKNHIVNAMLLYYDSVAEKAEISFFAQANVEKNVGISQLDLVSIISNILDNAFEACYNLKDIKKEVEITIYSKDDSFVCVCKNSFDGVVVKKGSKFYTRKEEKINHGLGTGIIQEIVSNLNGKCDFEHDEKQFSVTVYIPI